MLVFGGVRDNSIRFILMPYPPTMEIQHVIIIPKDLGMSSIGDFPYIPVLGMGCFDHQSYDFPGGVWILRSKTLHFTSWKLTYPRHHPAPLWVVEFPVPSPGGGICYSPRKLAGIPKIWWALQKVMPLICMAIFLVWIRSISGGVVPSEGIYPKDPCMVYSPTFGWFLW